MRRIHADGRQRPFVPNAGDTVGSGGVKVKGAAANQQQDEPKCFHSRQDREFSFAIEPIHTIYFAVITKTMGFAP